MRQITSRQLEALSFVRATIQDRGYPPTVREIAAHMGISSLNGVSDHLRYLSKKGYLTRDKMRARGLRVTQAGEALFQDTTPSEAAAESTDAELLRLAHNLRRLANEARATGAPSQELWMARKALVAAAERAS